MESGDGSGEFPGGSGHGSDCTAKVIGWVGFAALVVVVAYGIATEWLG